MADKSPVPLGIGLTATGVLIWFGPMLNLKWQESRITNDLKLDPAARTSDTFEVAYGELLKNLDSIVVANNQIMWGAALCLGALLLAIGVTLIISHYITLDVVVSSRAEDNPTGIAAALRGPAVLIGFVTLALWFIILTTLLPMLVNKQGKQFDVELVTLTGQVHGLKAKNGALTGERDRYKEVLEALARDNAQSVLIGFSCGKGSIQFANGWKNGGPQGQTGMLGPQDVEMAAEHSLTVEGGKAWHTIKVGHSPAGTPTPVLQVNVTDFGLAAIILLDDNNALYTLCNPPNNAVSERGGLNETATGTIPKTGQGGITADPKPAGVELETAASANLEG